MRCENERLLVFEQERFTEDVALGAGRLWPCLPVRCAGRVPWHRHRHGRKRRFAGHRYLRHLRIQHPGTSASESAAGDSLSDKTTDASANATSRLTSASSRNISKATGAIDAEREAARIAAEEAQRVEDAEHSAVAQTHRDSQYASDSGATATGLSEVDWNVSKAEFIEQWGSRIDTYLAGSTLSGYGTTFAEAAWDAGIDPRFSPAISNTESTKGQNCFRSHNAWGWMGDTSWSSWEEAIAAHAQGLANGYGYTISLANASKYCPPTYEDWYQKTLAQMQQI